MWTNIFSTQLDTEDPDTDFRWILPPVSGTVLLRVRDTDQTPGSTDLDTVFVDEMFLRIFF